MVLVLVLVLRGKLVKRGLIVTKVDQNTCTVGVLRIKTPFYALWCTSLLTRCQAPCSTNKPPNPVASYPAWAGAAAHTCMYTSSLYPGQIVLPYEQEQSSWYEVLAIKEPSKSRLGHCDLDSPRPINCQCEMPHQKYLFTITFLSQLTSAEIEIVQPCLWRFSPMVSILSFWTKTNSEY